MLDKHYKILSKSKSLTTNDLDAEPIYNNKTSKQSSTNM